MFKKIALVCALILAGCASPIATVEPAKPPVKEAPAWVELKTNYYSVSVPPDFINVKKADETLLDFVYRSPDSMLVVTLTTDETTSDLQSYATAFTQVMVSNGAELLQAREGLMGGLKAYLLVMGTDRRVLTLHFLTQDDRPSVSGMARSRSAPPLPVKVFYVSCAINPLLLKDKATTCSEIVKSFKLAPLENDAVHIRKLPE